MVFARMLSRGIAPFEFLKMHLYQYTQKIQLCSNRFDFLPLFLSGRVTSKFVVTRFSRDSRAVICMAENPMYRKSSRHIDTRRHFIGELVAAGTVKLTDCRTHSLRFHSSKTAYG